MPCVSFSYRRHSLVARWAAARFASIRSSEPQQPCQRVLGRDFWLGRQNVRNAVGSGGVPSLILDLFTSEILYEDPQFSQRELAALVASKVKERDGNKVVIACILILDWGGRSIIILVNLTTPLRLHWVPASSLTWLKNPNMSTRSFVRDYNGMIANVSNHELREPIYY